MDHTSCCRAAALDLAAQMCGSCGQSLVRCPAFSACGGLLFPGGGHCDHHLKLQGQFRSRAGGLSRDDEFSLEVDLTNIGADSLEVTRAFTRLVGGDWAIHQPPFHALAAMQRRTLPLSIGRLPQGHPTCEVAVACVATSGEEHLFGTQLRLAVGAGEKSVHIEINNSNFAAGATGVLSTGIGVDADGTPTERDDTCTLDRREGYEVELGVRGYAQQGARIQRDSVVRLTGAWQDKDKAIIARPFASGTEIFLGRNRASAPGDFHHERQLVSLRIYDSQGQLDRDRSMAVSGRQLKLTCRNDRVYVECVGRHEVRKNSAPLAHAHETLLEHDDVLELPGLRPIRIQCGVHSGRTRGAPGSLSLHRHP